MTVHEALTVMPSVDRRLGESVFFPDTEDEATVVRSIFDGNEYRVDASMLDYSGNVVDVGAAFGAFTCYAATLGARHVLAIEPNSVNFGRLRDAIDRNGFQHRAVAVHAAAGPHGTRARSVGASVHATTEFTGHDDVGGGSVECLTLDAMLDALPPGRYGRAEADVVKIDAEGVEFGLLDEASDAALAAVRFFTMEWHAGDLVEHIDVAPIGRLVQRLLATHRVEVLGEPHRGGMLWATRY